MVLDGEGFSHATVAGCRIQGYGDFCSGFIFQWTDCTELCIPIDVASTESVGGGRMGRE